MKLPFSTLWLSLLSLVLTFATRACADTTLYFHTIAGETYLQVPLARKDSFDLNMPIFADNAIPDGMYALLNDVGEFITGPININAPSGGDTGLILSAFAYCDALGAQPLAFPAAGIAAGTAINHISGVSDYVSDTFYYMFFDDLSGRSIPANGQGERHWEKGRGDDWMWDLSIDDLRNIENGSLDGECWSNKEKARARKIRKMKQKGASGGQDGKRTR